MIYGYARVSRPTQNIDRQERNIKQAYPDAFIVRDIFTRMTMDRTGWKNLFKRVKAGDTIVFDSVSRMSGNAEEGMDAYEELYNRGVSLVFLKEPHINTDTYKKSLEGLVALTNTNVDYILEGVNKYLIALAREQVKLAFMQSEKEVADLRQRTREGIETARLDGKQIGQKPGAKLNTKKGEQTMKDIQKYSCDFDGTLKDADVLKLTGVARNTLYKYKRILRDKAIDDFFKEHTGRYYTMYELAEELHMGAVALARRLLGWIADGSVEDTGETKEVVIRRDGTTKPVSLYRIVGRKEKTADK